MLRSPELVLLSNIIASLFVGGQRLANLCSTCLAFSGDDFLVAFDLLAKQSSTRLVARWFASTAVDAAHNGNQANDDENDQKNEILRV